jgi:hypothetical protein
VAGRLGSDLVDGGGQLGLAVLQTRLLVGGADASTAGRAFRALSFAEP